MNNNDIIKALKQCAAGGSCRHCPLEDELGCRMKLLAFSLETINRQKAEIESLYKENLDLKDGYFQKRYEEVEHEELLGLREAFRKSGMDYIDLNAEWEGKYKNAKCEAIKEFAEKLKAEITTGCGVLRVSTIDIIDNLVKEMTEGNTDE